MKTVFSAIEFPESQSGLNGFAVFLSQIDFPHRFSEHDDKIVLWVYAEDNIPVATQLYQRYLLQPDILVTNNTSKVLIDKKTGWQFLHTYPVTIVLTFFSIAGFYLFFAEKIELLSLFSFQGFVLFSDAYAMNATDVTQHQIISGQLWRLLTPIFLHFDIMHVTFNLAILWFLGRQIEMKNGSLIFSLLVICMGITSNIAQYYFSSSHLFGGMSGVNYGLLAYCAYVNRTYKNQVFLLPGGFLIVSLVMMVLGFLNIFSLLGYSIANWAHLAGFLSGLLLAIIITPLMRDIYSFKIDDMKE